MARGSHPLCKFGSSIVNGTVLLAQADQPLICYSPPHALETVALELTLNGQDYTTDLQRFDFYDVRLSSVSPVGGPHHGGALLTIPGHSLGAGLGYHRYLCRFEQGLYRTQVTATYLPALALVRCTAPAMPQPVRSLVTVAINGQQFTHTSVDFTFYNVTVASISPPYTIFDGGQLLNLTVSGLVNLTHPACKFDAHRPWASLALGFNDSVGVDRWWAPASSDPPCHRPPHLTPLATALPI